MEFSGQGLRGRGETQLAENLPLATGRPGGMNHATHRRGVDDQPIDLELAQQRFGGHALLRHRGVRRDGLTPISAKRNSVTILGSS